MTDRTTLRFSWRDRLVCAVCNWLLNHVASPDYRAMIGGSIRLGLKTAAYPDDIDVTGEDAFGV